MVDVNVVGTLLSCRAFARALVGDGERRGAIVTVSSQMGAVGYPDRVSYCATKHAVNGLTRALALEWAPRIRVNVVAPTCHRHAADGTDVRRRSRRGHLALPQGRLGTVDEAARAVLFLLSDDASLTNWHVRRRRRLALPTRRGAMRRTAGDAR